VDGLAAGVGAAVQLALAAFAFQMAKSSKRAGMPSSLAARVTNSTMSLSVTWENCIRVKRWSAI